MVLAGISRYGYESQSWCEYEQILVLAGIGIGISETMTVSAFKIKSRANTR